MPAKKKSTKKVIKKSVPKKTATKNINDYFGNDVSFKIVKEPKPFMTMQLTQQTFFWTVLLLIIMITQIFILGIQLSTNETLMNIK